MSKKTQIQLAIEKLDADIAVLQLARVKLLDAEKASQAKRKPRAVKPPAEKAG